MVEKKSLNVKANYKLNFNESSLKETKSIALSGFFEFGIKDNIQWWSKHAYKILGFELEKKLPIHTEFIKQMNETDVKRLNVFQTRAVKYGEDFSMTFLYNTPKTNEIKCISLNAEVIFDKNKNPKSIKGAIQDITEQKKLNDKLFKSEERLRLALKAANQGTYDLNIQTGETINSHEYASMLGYDPKIFIETNQKWIDRLHPDDIEITSKAYLNYIKGKTNEYKVEFRQKKKNGDWIWILSMGSIVERDNKGKPIRLLGTHTNITERKNIEKELRESEIKYRSFFNNSMDAILLTCPNGKITSANPAACKMFGYTENEIIQLERKGLIDPTDPRIPVLLSNRLKNGKARGELTILHKDKTPIQVEISSAIFTNDDNEAQTSMIIRNITESKEAERALIESEEKFKSLMCQSPFVVELYDLNGLQIEVNKAYEELWGFPASTTVNIFNILKSKEVVETGLIEYVNRAYAGESVKVPEYEFNPKGDTESRGFGRIRYLNTNIYPIKNSNGKVLNIVLIHQDVSERKKAQLKLAQSSKLLETSQFIAKLGGWELDISTNVLFWTAETYRIHDTTPQEFDPTVDAGVEYFLPESRSLITDALKLAIEEGKGYDLELETYTTKGRKIYVRTTCEVTVLDGKPAKLTGIFQDITSQKQTIRELANSFLREKKLGDIVRNAPIAIADGYPDGKIDNYNKAFIELVGYNDEELKKIKWNEQLTPPHWNEIEKEALQKLTSDNNSIQYEKECIHKNGTIIPVEIFIYGNFDKNNELVNFVGFLIDNTQRKKAQKELLSAKLKAEESDRLKSSFLANMSHEIRTPLNGILGFSDLLKNPKLSGETQREYIAIIEKGGGRLLSTINDIIDISKLESGHTKLLITETNINDQLEYVATFFRPEVEKKNVQLIVKNKLSKEDSIIRTDKEKVYAILTNLIKNAIKFTENGAIELSCTKKANTLEFYVKDSGSGIPKDRQEAIFDRFIQADIEDKRALQGSGLGLSISKAYIEMLGGKIWLSSKENIGTTFSFSIPLTTINKKTDAVIVENGIQDNTIRPLKILIADDDNTSKMLVSIAVKGIGKEILTVSNGLEAVEICRKNPDIDLVLMDIKMPIMNGHEATKQIRKLNKHIVIIAQTAYGLFGDRQKSLEVGCNDYISKPINKEKLIATISPHFLS